MTDHHPDQLLTLKQVCALIQVSRQTIHEWYTSGRFPRPFLLNPNDARTCRWYEVEVKTWIADRAAKRPA